MAPVALNVPDTVVLPVAAATVKRELETDRSPLMVVALWMMVLVPDKVVVELAVRAPVKVVAPVTAKVPATAVLPVAAATVKRDEETVRSALMVVAPLMVAVS